MLKTAWFSLRRRVEAHAWSAREALRCYRDALGYCAACDAEADAHEEAAQQARIAAVDRTRSVAMSLDDFHALEALYDAAWVWKRTPAGRADTRVAARLRAALARAENTDVARDNFIPF